MNYTYLLRCADGTLYCGWTNDPEKRLAAHNAGTGAKYTAARRPVSLVHLETFATKQEAMKREAAIKRMKRKDKLRLIGEKGEGNMPYENSTLGEVLSDPRIAPIAADAIRERDLSKEELWDKTLLQLKAEQIFAGEIGKGIRRLYQAADTGEWYYPLYTEAESQACPTRKGVNLVYLPSGAKEAEERPFILLVPGGGFVNVWNLTEGWPIAEQFNQLGYHVFILTYQVGGEEDGLLGRNMEDFARALRLIRENETKFHVQGGRYITCGFSAGGYLICLWNTGMGYSAWQLPKPEASFPVYPVVTLKKEIRYGSEDPEESLWLYGCPLEEAEKKDYEIPEHAQGFPPSAIFLAAGDTLVSPENSRMLARALEGHGIPCRLEIGPEGGHGFADGDGMCMAGWTERAVRWFEALPKK